MNLKSIKFQEMAVPKGKQALVNFGNEYQLSVVSHASSYGGDRGLYEIGVFKNNNMVEMPGITAEGDTVKGFLSESDVDVIIKKMHMVTGAEPTQK
jgi:hypothetical protein